MSKKNDEPFRIAGVHINEQSPDLQNAKTFEDLQKLEIFSHLPDKEREDAENKLATRLSLKKSGEVAN